MLITKLLTQNKFLTKLKVIKFVNLSTYKTKSNQVCLFVNIKSSKLLSLSICQHTKLKVIIFVNLSTCKTQNN